MSAAVDAPVRRALASLEAHRGLIRPEPLATPSNAAHRGVVLTGLASLAVVAVVLVLASVANGYTIMRPGPVDAASRVAGAPGSPKLLTTSVVIRTASPVDLVASWLGFGELIPKRLAPKAPSAAQFGLAREAAWAAAHRCVGTELTAAAPPSDARIRGASGGLMMALADVQHLRRRTLTQIPTAGTGSITADGAVHEVRNVAEKVQAAEASGAALFLVPPALEAEAATAATNMRVVGVGSLDEALRVLGQPGCSDGGRRT